MVWLAVYSWLMVWWATVFGNTIGIPSKIMGLTLLAAGTSVPDLITSVIVAKKKVKVIWQFHHQLVQIYLMF